MWCVAKLDEQYIARMEDVLGLFESIRTTKYTLLSLCLS